MYDCLAIGIRFERMLKFVLRKVRSIYILIEEPIHLVVAAQIISGVMYFSRTALKILGAGDPVGIGLDKFMHHFLEVDIRIIRPLVPKHVPHHLENVSPLRVDQIARNRESTLAV